MQKLRYLVVMGLVGGACINVVSAQSPLPAAQKASLANIDPQAPASIVEAKPSTTANMFAAQGLTPHSSSASVINFPTRAAANLVSNSSLAAAQAPTRRLSTSMIDASPNTAAKFDGLTTAKAVAGASIASVSMALRSVLAIGTLSKVTDRRMPNVNLTAASMDRRQLPVSAMTSTIKKPSHE